MSPEQIISDALMRYVSPPGRPLWGEERTDDKAAAILAALKSAGLVVVPVEPTEDICKAAARATGDAPHHSYWKTIYRAMIRAATSPGVPLAADPARRD